jgi:hypothetical protein
MRQMYGRASFILPRNRILHGWHHKWSPPKT